MAEVDPRFDPVFQRGYDPEKHRTRIREHRPARTETPREEPRPAEVTAPEPAPVVPAEEAEDEAAVARRNPFRLLLLLISLGAIAGAVALLWHRVTTDPYYFGAPASDKMALFMDELQSALLPSLTTGGLIGLTLWLALGALRRRDHD
jgi:hypothetical protein